MRTARVIAILLFVAVVAAAAWTFFRINTPYRGFQASEVFVELPAGTSQTEIARRLAAAGVVPDPWTFRLAAWFSRADRRLQAGESRFTQPTTPAAVVARLARGDVYAVTLTFPEGLTVHEMAAIFGRSRLGTAADFETAANDGSLAASFDPEAGTLEGYLFPSTYTVSHRSGAPETVRMMLNQFKKVFDAKLRDAAAARHLTVRQAVTLASVIEKETARPDERPLVSAVFQNRLAQRMPLQCDPTVIYALMNAGRWTGNLTTSDLQFDSPYNTYRYPGLPPGPIASPGRASLDAAVHPADVPYLYFVSRNDGTHVFASTLEEHNHNVAERQKKLTKAGR
jgi:UPF0755 protein